MPKMREKERKPKKDRRFSPQSFKPVSGFAEKL
jgi:hypothetical protein